MSYSRDSPYFQQPYAALLWRNGDPPFESGGVSWGNFGWLDSTWIWRCPNWRNLDFKPIQRLSQLILRSWLRFRVTETDQLWELGRTQPHKTWIFLAVGGWGVQVRNILTWFYLICVQQDQQNAQGPQGPQGLKPWHPMTTLPISAESLQVPVLNPLKLMVQGGAWQLATFAQVLRAIRLQEWPDLKDRTSETG